MRSAVTIALLSIVLTSGCAQPMQLGTALLAPQSPAVLEVGRDYTIQMAADEAGVVYDYQGTLSRSNDRELVLTDATVTASVTRGLDIPVVGRMFKNTNVATEDAAGDLVVERNRVHSITETPAVLNGGQP